MGKSVNIPPEEAARAEELWNDPVLILNLVDLIFGVKEYNLPPS